LIIEAGKIFVGFGKLFEKFVLNQRNDVYVYLHGKVINTSINNHCN